jgi:hypothetical protein
MLQLELESLAEQTCNSATQLRKMASLAVALSVSSVSQTLRLRVCLDEV